MRDSEICADFKGTEIRIMLTFVNTFIHKKYCIGMGSGSSFVAAHFIVTYSVSKQCIENILGRVGICSFSHQITIIRCDIKCENMYKHRNQTSIETLTFK